MVQYPEITVKELGKKLKTREGFILLDVRERDEVALARLDDVRVVYSP
jgi:rhodanese-related sulfurtransferase